MKYFKTDGIRGEAYSEVTLSLAYLLGMFFANSDKSVVIGIDTRESSPEIANAVYNGVKKNKKTKYAGVIPTPGLMYYSLTNNCIGIMVTASHNLYKDNGIKVFEDGKKINKETVKQIESFIDKNADIVYKDEFLNDLLIDEGIISEYKKFIKKRITKESQNVIFDGANGAFSYLLKELFDNKNLINCEPNGKNINLDCGSNHVSNLINQVKNRKVDYGFAFDGDGDRVCVVDKFNRIYEGDFLTFVFAKFLFDNNQLLSNTVVFTEVVNPGILERVEELGMYYIIVEIGDQNIYTALENGYLIGGEASGHIINKTILPFGDGLVNALELLKILHIGNKKLHEYSYGIKMHYCKKYNLLINPDDFNLSKRTKFILDSFIKRKKLKLIIRKSGTENLVRLFLYQEKSNSLSNNINKIIRIISNDKR